MPFDCSGRKRHIKIVGIIFAIAFASQVPYLFPHPFQENEGIRDLATKLTQAPNWIRQESQVKDKTADELTKRMMTELRIAWVESALYIVIGLLSGLLLVLHKKEGYWLAFFLSLFLLFIRYRTVTFSLRHYEFLLHHAPVRTCHDILMSLVLLYTVIVIGIFGLLRKKNRDRDLLNNDEIKITDGGL